MTDQKTPNSAPVAVEAPKRERTNKCAVCQGEGFMPLETRLLAERRVRCGYCFGTGKNFD